MDHPAHSRGDSAESNQITYLAGPGLVGPGGSEEIEVLAGDNRTVRGREWRLPAPLFALAPDLYDRMT